MHATPRHPRDYESVEQDFEGSERSVVSYDCHFVILRDNSGPPDLVVARVYSAWRTDWTGGTAICFPRLSKIKRRGPIVVLLSTIMYDTGSGNFRMQLVAIALAVTSSAIFLAFRSHAARRILDLVCNVRQSSSGSFAKT